MVQIVLLIIIILLIMVDIIFIKPGHYRRKGERVDGHEDIIRVLGPDPNDDTRWITNRGSMTDAEIKARFEPYDTSLTEEPVVRSRPIIGDLSAPPSIPQHITQHQPITQPQPQQQITEQKPSVQPIVQESLESQILSKCQTKQHNLVLNIPISTTIDFEKLKQSISLFNLNEQTLANVVLQTINSDDLIKGIVKLFHTTDTGEQIIPEPTIPEIYTNIRNLTYEQTQTIINTILPAIQQIQTPVQPQVLEQPQIIEQEVVNDVEVEDFIKDLDKRMKRYEE